MNYTRTFSSLNASDVTIAGGKGASLGEMFQAGISVPDGYVILAATFEKFIQDTGLVEEIDTILSSVNHREIHTVEFASEKIQGLIQNVEIPHDMQSEMVQAFQDLGAEFVAVRSSATAEDGTEHAWAGQLDSYLNVTSENLLQKIQHCWASLFTPRAIFYRFEKGLHTTHISVAVVVQKMVNSKISGIAFSVHPVTEDRNQVIIEAGFGLGEAIVSGTVTPDAYVVKKQPREIIDIAVSEQSRGLFRSLNGGNEWRELGVEGTSQVLSEAQILELSNIILHIEKHYGFPCDIEWAFEGGKFYITQSRPITTLSHTEGESFGFNKNNYICVGQWIAPVLEYELWLEWAHTPESKALSLPEINSPWIMIDGHFFKLKNDLYAFIKDKIFEELKQNKYDFIKSIIEKAEQISYECIQASKNINKDLSFWQFLEYFDIMHRLRFPWTSLFPIDEAATEYIQEYARKNSLDFDDIFASLPQLTNSISEDQKMLLQFQYEIKKENLQFSIEYIQAKKPALSIRIQDYQIETEYLGTHHMWGEGRTILKLMQAIETAHENNKIPSAPKHFDLEILAIMAEVGRCRLECAQSSAKLAYALRPSLTKFAEKVGITYNDIIQLTTQEISVLIQGGILDINLIKNRKDKFALYRENSAIKILTGKECNEIADIFGCNETYEDITSIKGNIGNKGKVRGVVAIVRQYEDIYKVKPGMVLVAPETTPDCIPAMTLAVAFVTDIGGITSHAAIISREMGKPCIIGTKNATKILKDGDLVEVDADNGMVRIIEKSIHSTILEKKWEFSSERQMSFHMMHLFHVGYSELNSLLGTNLTTTLYYTKNGNVSHYGDENELTHAREVIADTLSDQTKVQTIESYIQTRFHTYQSDIALLPEADTVQPSELWNLYQKHIAIESSISAASWIIFATFLDAMTTLLTQKLSRHYDAQTVKNILDILSRPTELTPLECYENDLVQYQTTQNESLKSEIIKKYRHMGMFDIFSSPKVWNDHLTRLKEAKVTPLREIPNQTFPPDVAPLVQLYSTYANIKEWKNFWREQLSYKYFLLFQKIGTITGHSSEEISWMTFYEVESLLGGQKINVPIPERRQESICIFQQNNTVNIITDKDTLNSFCAGLGYSTQLTGYPLGGGIIQGKVCVIISPDDYSKFEENDILVTSTTRPDQMHLMRACGAIITNEGGLLSHAAIMARELKKPCIIGTKNATKILKDGDLVEVDADNGVVRIIEKNKDIFEKDWQLTATRNMPLWHDILCLYGWEDNMGNYGINGGGKCLFAIENSTHTSMFVEPEEQSAFFREIEKSCQNGEDVRNLRKLFNSYAQEVQDSLQKLGEFTNKENLKKFFSDYQRFTAGLWITTGFGRIGTEKLIEALKENGTNESHIPEMVSILTYPAEHTPLFLSQSDMIEIAIKVQKSGKIDTKKELNDWLEIHKYIPVNFCEDPWTINDAEDQLKNMLEQNCNKLADDLIENHKQKLKERKILQEKSNKNIGDISDALAEMTSLNEYRKNIFCRLSYDIRYVFAEMMKKVGSNNWRDAYYCTPDELIKILEGQNIDMELIKTEREKVVFVRDGGEIMWGSSDQIKYFFEKVYQKIERNDNEMLKGFSANKGKIIGTVKVVLSTKDFHKVQRGDILVATMTSVDFVPIMEKAGAFVTDEGGITSHASIVAREMNKPCIIGTKNATQALKDGDIVEVDADNGVVKILNNV